MPHQYNKIDYSLTVVVSIRVESTTVVSTAVESTLEKLSLVELFPQEITVRANKNKNTNFFIVLTNFD